MTIYRDQLISENIVTRKNKINPMIIRSEKFNKSIKWINEICLNGRSLNEKIYIIYNDIEKIPTCKFCEKIVIFHGFTKGYSLYCSHKCYTKDITSFEHPMLKKSEKEKQEIYNKSVLKRRKNGTYIFSEDTKEKMSISAKNSMIKKRKTCLERYGVENPGILGGNSSKAAEKYILEFITSRNFSLDQCYFNSKELNKFEFYQMIKIQQKNKLKYVQYDLVVFTSPETAKNKNTSDILFVLEYNGPWHYTLKEVLENPTNPSYPYNTCKTTRKESYIHDLYKRLHFKNIEYYTYWEKSKQLIKYN